jgi:hypothetical protein
MMQKGLAELPDSDSNLRSLSDAKCILDNVGRLLEKQWFPPLTQSQVLCFGSLHEFVFKRQQAEEEGDNNQSTLAIATKCLQYEKTLSEHYAFPWLKGD